MSTKGLELDYGVQGTELQKSVMQTLLMSLAQGSTHFTSLSGDTNNTVEADRQTSMTKAGKVGKAFLLIRSNSLDGETIITLKKNGSNATPLIQFTIPATNSVDQESPLLIDFDPKDLIGWSLTSTAGVGNMLLRLTVQMELEA